MREAVIRLFRVKESIWLIFTFSLLLVPKFSYASGLSCASFLNYQVEAAVYEGVEYNIYKRKKIRVKDVAASDDVVLGFREDGHTNIYFRGYKIDSKGLPGIRVKSLLLKGDSFDGVLLVVLKDLPVSVLDRLSNAVENFNPVTRLSCVGVSCSYLKRSFFHRHFLLPHKLLERLLSENLQGQNIEFYTLDGHQMEYLISNFKEDALVSAVINVGSPVATVSIMGAWIKIILWFL